MLILALKFLLHANFTKKYYVQLKNIRHAVTSILRGPEQVVFIQNNNILHQVTEKKKVFFIHEKTSFLQLPKSSCCVLLTMNCHFF